MSSSGSGCSGYVGLRSGPMLERIKHKRQ
jgi:hypothetical protein